MDTVPAPPSLYPRPPWALSLLSSIHDVVAPRKRGPFLLRALQVRRLARLWLRAAVVERQRHRPDDVTVLIGIRDRADHRLAVALQSIRNQNYPADRVHILVVDYGSKPAAAEFTAGVCRAHRADYVRVEATGAWSRSRCLNVGIRRTTTKYLLVSDVDILFSSAYIAEAVRTLHASPLSVVCSAMLDLPEETRDVLRRACEAGDTLCLPALKESTEPRLGLASHPSIAMTYTAFYHLIRGYDEFYELWGGEDRDLFSRLMKLGLDGRTLDADDTFYLHQWHPKYENIPGTGREQVIRKNTERWYRARTILRNDAEWGAARMNSP